MPTFGYAWQAACDSPDLTVEQLAAITRGSWCGSSPSHYGKRATEAKAYHCDDFVFCMDQRRLRRENEALPCTVWMLEYRAPTRIYAFVLAGVSGALLATAHYVSGAITGVLAIVLLAAWKFARKRGDDDRHTLW